MANKFTLDGPLGIDLTEVVGGTAVANPNIVPKHALGTRVRTDDGVYQYVQNQSTAIALTTPVVAINPNDFTIAAFTYSGTAPKKIGVAQVAIPAGSSTYPTYAWVFVGPGKCTAYFDAATTADVVLYAAAGLITDASSNANKIAAIVKTDPGGNATGTLYALEELKSIL